jgi:hypothetical protein
MAGKGAPKGNSYRKGKPLKLTQDIRDMIKSALDEAGGKDYLLIQARDNPVAFMGLVGKLVPKDINANVKADLVMTTISRVIVDGTDNTNT